MWLTGWLGSRQWLLFHNHGIFKLSDSIWVPDAIMVQMYRSVHLHLWTYIKFKSDIKLRNKKITKETDYRTYEFLFGSQLFFIVKDTE